MSWFADLYRSAVGKKAVMAVTGIILFGFVLVHMIGNLKLYEGPQSMLERLRRVPARGRRAGAARRAALLWIVRARAARRRRPPHLGRLAAHRR